MVIDRIEDVRWGAGRVMALMVPVVSRGREGLLVVRRAIAPVGKLVLAGVVLDRPVRCVSLETRGDRELVFGTTRRLGAEALPPFEPTHESQERGVIFGAGGIEQVMAFPLHVVAAQRHFEERGIAGRCDYAPL